jgi:predicted dehydrogenase
MGGLTGRDFLKGSMAAGASLVMASANSRVLGANNDIRLAVVGLGWQGANNQIGQDKPEHIGGHCDFFSKLDGVRLVAICDVDSDRVDWAGATLKKQGITVKGCRDYRQILDDKNIDVVTFASPNHWHSLMTVQACQAGKDVYVEKPVSHEIWEGRRMVEAARKYSRIVQTGTQNRSDVGLLEAIPYIQEGSLGKIKWVRCLCYRQRDGIGKVNGPQPIPESVDYDLWTGPAELTPLMRERLHYDWHWVWNTGCGDIGNQGVHEMDVTNWALGLDKLAPRVISIGGRFGFNDDGQTANTEIIFLDYKPAPIYFEVLNLPRKKGERVMSHYRDIRVGNVIQCENGYFAGGRGGGWAYDNDGNKIKQFKGDGGGGHHQNFIDAVRSRKESDLRAPILGGHISSCLCHMSNISLRLGRKASVEEIKNTIGDNAEFMDSFERMLENLKANEIDLDKNPITMGPMLTMDSDKEQFVGDYSEWANMYVKRNYRQPFVVPEQV